MYLYTYIFVKHKPNDERRQLCELQCILIFIIFTVRNNKKKLIPNFTQQRKNERKIRSLILELSIDIELYYFCLPRAN